MSDIVNQDRPEMRKASRFIAILILVALFVPHSLGISHFNQPDNSFIRYSVSAVFWTISYESGSAIAGPYSSTLFEFLSIPTLLFGAVFLPLYAVVILTQSRFIKGTTTKRSILRVIGITLIIQVFLQLAILGYRLDGWASLQTYPLPFFHILNVLSVVRQRGSESMAEPDLQDLPRKPRSEFSVRGAVRDAIITSCFSCVSIVLFVMGGIMLISNLLMGLGFLAFAMIVIIVLVKSKYW